MIKEDYPCQPFAMHTDCARSLFSAGQVYLVTSIVQNRDPVFTDFEQGRLVVDALRKAQQEELALSLAWVVMPDIFIG